MLKQRLSDLDRGTRGMAVSIMLTTPEPRRRPFDVTWALFAFLAGTALLLLAVRS